LALWVSWSGFALAFVFGAVANKTNFCTMGAVSDVVHMGHWGRMRMWLLAIAVALAGSNTLHMLGLVDLSKSIYLRPTLPWVSFIVGGLCFGVGMTLASGCANKNLIRIGGGSMRSLVVVTFIGIAAYMTLKGLFGQWRVTVLDQLAIDLSNAGVKTQGFPELLAAATGLAEKSARLLLVAAIAGGLLLFILKDRRFRQNRNQMLGGLIVGLIVTAGWYVTGHLGYGEKPETLETVYFGTNTKTIESLSFVAPTAYSLELLLLWTDRSLAVTFGIASVGGVIFGSFAYAITAGHFRWDGFISTADTCNHIVGGILMGFGGVTALGCTVGQGVSGLSTLALGSFIAFFAIIAGAAGTMKYLYWRETREPAPGAAAST